MTTDLVRSGITEKGPFLRLAKKCFFWPKCVLSQKKISLFFGLNPFLAKKHFLAKRKNGRFSVIPAQPWSVVILGHFFDGPDGPTKFRRYRSKIKGTYTFNVGMAQKGQKQG